MRFPAFLFAVAFAGSLASCQVNYYGQAAIGQLEVVRKQRPSKKVLADSETSEDLAEQLRLVERLIAFAEEELLLPNGGNYTKYADLGREYVLWSVFATPELSVEPVQWTYPIFGGLDYRGYFRQEAATKFGEKLRAKGHDVAVAEVPAYSTLGWFKDPVLNTFVDWDEEDLAALIFHELAHRKYYRHGDTEFSESFAVAVEQEGVRRWFRAQGDQEALTSFETGLGKTNRFVSRILRERSALEQLYASDLTEHEKRQAKRARLDELQVYIRGLLRDAGRDDEDTIWLRDNLGNAHLNIVATYHEGIPRFEALLKECGGDLAMFYERVKDLSGT